jgi:hypothetical protein
VTLTLPPASPPPIGSGDPHFTRLARLTLLSHLFTSAPGLCADLAPLAVRGLVTSLPETLPGRLADATRAAAAALAAAVSGAVEDECGGARGVIAANPNLGGAAADESIVMHGVPTMTSYDETDEDVLERHSQVVREVIMPLVKTVGSGMTHVGQRLACLVRAGEGIFFFFFPFFLYILFLLYGLHTSPLPFF